LEQLSFTKKFSLIAPYDPEIDIKVRDNLDYFVTFPSGFDESKKYGLVFCIPGWGEHAESEYYAGKLRPYIADKYDLIAVGVRYHNDLRTNDNYTIDIANICNFYGIPSDYFKNLRNFGQIQNDLFDLLVSRNLLSLDPRLALKSNCYHRYSSFGLMPAIDHLNVLFDIIQNFNIDKRKIIAFGSSYGGYIACLMAKYAPHTFSLVIDNSGFCVTRLDEIFGVKMGTPTGSFPRYINNRRYEIPFATDTLWSMDETSPYYFSDAHKNIRNLLLKEHRTPSSTVYCCYHSVNDTLAPINLKDKMCEILKDYNVIYYKRVEETDIDGSLFKTMRHGMDASLQKLFDVSIKKYEENNHIKEEEIDFDKQLTYGFPCMDRMYHFTYRSSGLGVEIEKLF
jgi:pimeloyl-ACP methyl ester carboxylesterase